MEEFRVEERSRGKESMQRFYGCASNGNSSMDTIK